MGGPPAGTYKALDMSDSHGCAVQTSGRVMCWGGGNGSNIWSFLGNNWSAGFGTFVAIAVSDLDVSCGVKDDESLVCWNVQRQPLTGDLIFGSWTFAGSFRDVSQEEETLWALRTDATIARPFPREPEVPEGSLLEVSSGGIELCAVKSDHAATCYWHGVSWMLPGSYTQIDAGDGVCGIDPDGNALSYRSIAQTNVLLPPSGSFLHVAAGAGVSPGNFGCCGVKVDGTMTCWDRRGEGAAPAGTFSRVALSPKNGCAIRSDGSLYCWGEDRLGQSTPPAGTFREVSVGPNHGCAIRTNGTLACWGRNDNGEADAPLGTFQYVSAGGGHTCAIRTNGEVVCFGSNGSGQSSPPAGTFTRVTVGGTYSCGIRPDQSLTCWGERAVDYGNALIRQ
jgi:hypothetical protein